MQLALSTNIRLTGFVFSPIDVPAMVHFYNAVFDSDLRPFEALGTTLHRGQIAGLRLIFCPNDLLEIRAEKNRQQLSFAVDDLDEMVRLALNHGGTQTQAISDGPNGRACGIADPDGNTIELTEAT